MHESATNTPTNRYTPSEVVQVNNPNGAGPLRLSAGTIATVHRVSPVESSFRGAVWIVPQTGPYAGLGHLPVRPEDIRPLPARPGDRVRIIMEKDDVPAGAEGTVRSIEGKRPSSRMVIDVDGIGPRRLQQRNVVALPEPKRSQWTAYLDVETYAHLASECECRGLAMSAALVWATLKEATRHNVHVPINAWPGAHQLIRTGSAGRAQPHSQARTRRPVTVYLYGEQKEALESLRVLQGRSRSNLVQYIAGRLLANEYGWPSVAMTA